MNDKNTHLVATEAQYNKQLVRIKDAIDADVVIVNYDWLVASLESEDPVDETSYILHASKSTKAPKPAVNGKAHTNGSSTPVSQANANGNAPAQGSRKRPLEIDDEEDQEDVNPKKPKNALDTKSIFKAKIPVDEVYLNGMCGGTSTCEVYVDDEGVPRDVTLNQTQAQKNANKFYRMQLLAHSDGTYYCWTRWGRVGESGQNKRLGDGDLDDALREFDKKFKDKTGNLWENRSQPAKAKKYTLIEISYEESEEEEDLPGAGERRTSKVSTSSSGSSKSIETTLPPAVAKLMALIFNVDLFDSALAELEYDVNKMPLGKLSRNSVLSGYSVLKELASLIGAAGSLDVDAVVDLSNQYFSLIPHAFGRNRPPTLQSSDLIKKEITLLETLTDMQVANDIMKTATGGRSERQQKMNLLDRQYEGLNMEEMTPLDHGGTEFQELADYLIKSSGQTHNISYKVTDIFRIERQGETGRFSKSKFAAMGGKSDRRLLWHGSRTGNFGGILSQGLRIAPPEAPVSGYMFGKGIYLANMSTKSAGYCASHSSNGTGLLLLCDAELGKPPLRLTGADYNAGDQAKASNCISTFGVGRTAPKGWKDAACVNPNLKGVSMPDVSMPFGPSGEAGAGLLYDEMIVYTVEQLKLRYLFRVEMGGGYGY